MTQYRIRHKTYNGKSLTTVHERYFADQFLICDTHAVHKCIGKPLDECIEDAMAWILDKELNHG